VWVHPCVPQPGGYFPGLPEVLHRVRRIVHALPSSAGRDCLTPTILILPGSTVAYQQRLQRAISPHPPTETAASPGLALIWPPPLRSFVVGCACVPAAISRALPCSLSGLPPSARRPCLPPGRLHPVHTAGASLPAPVRPPLRKPGNPGNLPLQSGRKPLPAQVFRRPVKIANPCPFGSLRIRSDERPGASCAADAPFVAPWPINPLRHTGRLARRRPFPRPPRLPTLTAPGPVFSANAPRSRSVKSRRINLACPDEVASCPPM
jgi:hypothetical protein